MSDARAEPGTPAGRKEDHAGCRSGDTAGRNGRPVDATVWSAAAILLGARIGAAPVADHDGRMTGIVSETGLMDRPESAKETASVSVDGAGGVESVVSKIVVLPAETLILGQPELGDFDGRARSG